MMSCRPLVGVIWKLRRRGSLLVPTTACSLPPVPLPIDGFTCCNHAALVEAFGDVVVCPNQTGLRRYPDMVLRNPVDVSRSFHAAGRELTELTTDLSAELRDCYGCVPWL